MCNAWNHSYGCTCGFGGLGSLGGGAYGRGHAPAPSYGTASYAQWCEHRYRKSAVTPMPAAVPASHATRTETTRPTVAILRRAAVLANHFLAAHVGFFYGFAFWLGATFSFTFSVVLSLVALNATAALFVGLSNEEVVKHLEQLAR